MKLISILSVLVTLVTFGPAFSLNHVVEIVKRQGDTGSGGNSASGIPGTSTITEGPAGSSSDATYTSSLMAMTPAERSSASSASASSASAASAGSTGAAASFPTGQWAMAGGVAAVGYRCCVVEKHRNLDLGARKGGRGENG